MTSLCRLQGEAGCNMSVTAPGLSSQTHIHSHIHTVFLVGTFECLHGEAEVLTSLCRAPVCFLPCTGPVPRHRMMRSTQGAESGKVELSEVSSWKCQQKDAVKLPEQVTASFLMGSHTLMQELTYYRTTFLEGRTQAAGC